MANRNEAERAAQVNAHKSREVFIPKESKNDTQQYIAVNGRRMLVQKGKRLDLPAPFAEVVENAQAAQANAETYIEANVNDG